MTDAPIRSHKDAVDRLSDREYFRWAQEEARKFFESLIAKRFPQLAPPRTPR